MSKKVWEHFGGLCNEEGKEHNQHMQNRGPGRYCDHPACPPSRGPPRQTSPRSTNLKPHLPLVAHLHLGCGSFLESWLHLPILGNPSIVLYPEHVFNKHLMTGEGVLPMNPAWPADSPFQERRCKPTAPLPRGQQDRVSLLLQLFCPDTTSNPIPLHQTAGGGIWK